MTFSKSSSIALSHCQKVLGVKGLKAEKPRNPEHGDVAVALFEAAKELKKSPFELAQKIAGEKPPKEFSKVAAVGPYANFFYSQQYLAEELKNALKKDFSKSTQGKGKTAVLEYCDPNIGKPMHVGHIRSTILGDAVNNLLKESAWKTITMNYLGDSGSQVAKLLLAFEKFRDMPKPENEKVMFDYYVKINKAIEENPKLKEDAQKILEKLESGDKKTVAKAVDLRKKSYVAFQRNLDILDISFDKVIGESEFIEPSKKIVKEMLKKKIAFKDKTGEIVAGLEPEQPNTIILRSNGTTLYNTRDLALAEYKLKKYKYGESVIFTAQEQNTHFAQVHLMLKKLGKKSASGFKHVGFGLVNLEEGRMSTREGRVVFLEDVLNQAIGFAREEVEKRERTTNVEKTAKAIGIGSVKFAFLRISPEKTITFDPKKSVEFEGDTGAYVQYSHVRCASIIEKAGKLKAGKISGLDAHEEKLAKKIIEFPDVIAQSAKSLSPHVLCDYLLSLSHEFNSFYANCQVLESERRETRMALVQATKNALGKGLTLLGIDAIEKM